MINDYIMFRKLHNNNNPLSLPNIWDVVSAYLFESLDAKAIAITSTGVSWALDYAHTISLKEKL